MSEYEPHPLFIAGSLQTAPADVRKTTIDLASDFSRKAEALSHKAQS